jgi:hypothetical protein
MIDNPFAVISPEMMDAQKADQLFVEMYSEYPSIRRPGNTIISGARGSGKSMLIRCLLPDVLMLKTPFEELDFLAFRIPIRKTDLNRTELKKLDEKHAPDIINEHFMALHVLANIFDSLSKIEIPFFCIKAYQEFFEYSYSYSLALCGCDDVVSPDYTSSSAFFKSIWLHIRKLFIDFNKYIREISRSDNFMYDLPVFSFIRFIFPVIESLVDLPGFPKKKNIYLFLDDADNLSEIQTKILNSWLACRTQPTVSIKVSTQIGLYKSYYTTNDVLIESPHDYQNLNISYRYTTDTTATNEDNYYRFAIRVLKNRLELANIKTDPKEYFPPYQKQEEGINEQENRIREEYKTNPRGYRENDDVRRYAIPDYIKSLGGMRKSSMTYKYAGINNIIHLSSGIIRYLLDAASEMYDKMLNKYKDGFTNVDYRIQDIVMREQADKFLFSELRKADTSTQSVDEESSVLETIASPQSDIDKLQNLINAMGKTFHDILISNRSERKVFSIALTNVPDHEIARVLSLGVRLGFLHEMRIGNKQGNGRTWLYVLNRCFAPLFTLDPTGFQGYLFMKNDDLHKAMNSGNQLRRVSMPEALEAEEDLQISMFDYSIVWED